MRNRGSPARRRRAQAPDVAAAGPSEPDEARRALAAVRAAIEETRERLRGVLSLAPLKEKEAALLASLGGSAIREGSALPGESVISRSSAVLDGSGAIAQGAGAVAGGEGSVVVGRDVYGNVTLVAGRRSCSRRSRAATASRGWPSGPSS
jgi:hypothetical protein